ncbi:MAG: T9SS type A sorting domain-containing protein [Bacteroidetes bacterium]|nr:T9SS type A sorting domain-containing protein [Bacteroidota bacterium]
MNLNRVASLILCSLFLSTLTAQVSEDIVPRSYSLPESFFHDGIASLPVLSPSDVAALDYRDDKLGHMPRFARSVQTDISPTNAGTWYDVADGRIWRCHIRSAGALALIPCYDAWYLPQGATLHVYTPDMQEVIGAFTSVNTSPDGHYNTGLIHGDECIIEYYEPAAVADKGKLHLNEVGYAYRMVPGRKASRNFGDADACEVNIACSEGADWQDEKNAVVRMLVKLSSGYGWCTGTLMNNTNNDCEPYILSADHCYQDESNNYVAATAAQLNQWVFYFDYESPTCANPAAEGTLGTNFVTGCSLRAASQDNGGDNGSDFVLVRTNVSPPARFNPYYAGWSRGTATTSGVGIHHPNGDIKKISTYTSQPSSSHWGTLTLNTHWKVLWAATANGYGVTEPGSSGSGLFDSNHRLIGTLTGGGSSCSSPTQNDFYGEVRYHWTSNGLTSDKQLGPWLDPVGTNATTFDGAYDPCGMTIGIADVDAMINTAVYPNPSTGLFTVKNNAGMTSLTVTNAIGEVVMVQDITGRTTAQVDMSSYAGGVYFFRFASARGAQTRKVVLDPSR